MIGHYWEYVLVSDVKYLGYDSEGNCKGDVVALPPKPVKLQWNIPKEAQKTFNTCMKVSSWPKQN